MLRYIILKAYIRWVKLIIHLFDMPIELILLLSSCLDYNHSPHYTHTKTYTYITNIIIRRLSSSTEALCPLHPAAAAGPTQCDAEEYRQSALAPCRSCPWSR